MAIPTLASTKVASPDGTVFTVKVMKLSLGYVAAVYLDGQLDGMQRTEPVNTPFFITEDAARAAANQAWIRIQSGKWETKAQAKAREEAKRAALDAELEARVVFSFSDEGLDASHHARVAAVLRPIPAEFRRGIMGIAHFYQNVGGGNISSNIYIARDEWISRGADQAALDALKAETSRHNAKLMGW